MTKDQLADALRLNFFGDRGSDIQAALDYATMVIEALPIESRSPAWTALHVVVNTIANAIRELPEALPATPEIVTLAPADDPSRGSWSEKDLNKLIDARLDHWMEDQLDSRIKNWIEENFDLEHEIETYMENSVDFTDIIKDEFRNNLTISVSVD